MKYCSLLVEGREHKGGATQQRMFDWIIATAVHCFSSNNTVLINTYIVVSGSDQNSETILIKNMLQ